MPDGEWYPSVPKIVPSDFSVGEDVLIDGLGGLYAVSHKATVKKINKNSITVNLYHYIISSDFNPDSEYYVIPVIWTNQIMESKVIHNLKNIEKVDKNSRRLIQGYAPKQILGLV